MNDSFKWHGSNIALTGCWEPLMVLRRWGRSNPDIERHYQEIHTEKVIRELADNGINYLITHFHKGFGRDAESEEWQLLKTQIEFCHRHGIRAGVYFRIDNIITETFANQDLNVRDMLAENHRGEHPRHSQTAPWRYKICFNSAAYRKYAMKVIKYAIQELKADSIHFDGFAGRIESQTCKCRKCRKGFTKYLLEKWRDRRDEFTKYFGHDCIEGIEIPVWQDNYAMASINEIIQPDFQEWIRYKCKVFAEFHDELCGYARQLKSDIVICLNSGISSRLDKSAFFGEYLPALKLKNEIIFIEDGHFPAFRENGILCGRIRDYKVANTLKTQVMTYSHFHKESQFLLRVAESMAFNHGHFGHLGNSGDLLKIIRHEPEKKAVMNKVISWGKERHNIFHGTETASETAVLRNFASMSFNTKTTYRHVMLTEQLLIQKHIPFDIIFDESLGDKLSKYKLLILANQVCLNRETVNRIISFVKAGGNLFITGETGNYDENYRLRSEHPLIAGLELKLTGGSFISRAEEPLVTGFSGILNACANWPDKPMCFTDVHGKSRVAYVPDVFSGTEKENWNPKWSYDGINHIYNIQGEVPENEFIEYAFTNWKLPANSNLLLDRIRWALKASAFIDAPESVAINWTEKKSERKEFIHFVNYENEDTLKELTVHVKADIYRKAFFHIFEPEFCVIEFNIGKEETIINVPEFRTYGILELERNEHKEKNSLNNMKKLASITTQKKMKILRGEK